MTYLDANATTPIAPEVLDAMLPWLRDGYANASGACAASREARRVIDEAREKVAVFIGAKPEEIVFTGGGTESVNTALVSLDRLSPQGHGMVSAIEHSAVLRCVEQFTRPVRVIPVDRGGRLDVGAVRSQREGAAWISVMAANNETGVIQPLREVVALAKEHGLPVHTDAVQAAGKMPVRVKEWGVDLLSLSAHKFYGPKGVGALYIREGLRFSPLLVGGGQEGGRRSGTENIAGIVGMGAAAEWAANRLAEEGAAVMAEIRDVFESLACESIAGVTVNGDRSHRLPNTSHMSIDGCDASGLLILLDEAGVACSAGSACMTGKQKPSHVQVAMGIDEDRARSSLRFSFSMMNTMADATTAVAALKQAVDKLRRVQGRGVGPVTVYSS
jgi:cysteine desulfurase